MESNNISRFQAGPCGEIQVTQDGKFAEFDLGTIEEVSKEANETITAYLKE